MTAPNRWSPPQIAAVVELVLDHSLTPGKAAAAAAEGLPGLEPFSMPTATVKSYAGAARRERRTVSAGRNHDRRIDDILAVLIDTLSEKVSAVTAQPIGDVNASELGVLVRAACAARRGLAESRPPLPPPAKRVEPEPARGALAALESALDARDAA